MPWCQLTVPITLFCLSSHRNDAVRRVQPKSRSDLSFPCPHLKLAVRFQSPFSRCLGTFARKCVFFVSLEFSSHYGLWVRQAGSGLALFDSVRSSDGKRGRLNRRLPLASQPNHHGRYQDPRSCYSHHSHQLRAAHCALVHSHQLRPSCI
jgi:hypothetical protein